MIVDTSALIALFNGRDPRHNETSALMNESDQELVVSPYVVAEVDYLVGRRLGVAAELMVLNELSDGPWSLVQLTAADVRRAVNVVERYRDQRIGITDASLVVLAERHRTNNIATLDRRHFEVLMPLQGGRFEIVP